MGARRLDVMGYRIAPVRALVSDQAWRAAKRLARAYGYQWDCVGTDPRVIGWRFIRDAHIVLTGRDLGDRCPIRGDGSPR